MGAGREASRANEQNEVALTGHFAVSPGGSSSNVSTGTFVACRSGVEQRLVLRFHCARGARVLKREKAAWQMTVTDDHGGAFGRKSLERSVPCVGHRNSHQAFLNQVRSCGHGNATEVDISVNYALVDTAILGSMLSSIRSNGASMAFKYSN